MSVIQFSAPPLPHYILSGYSLAGPGRKHPERNALGEFDLFVVKQGCHYIGEADRHYEVSAGHALVLRPDQHHYPTAGCQEKTISYYLHFYTTGHWQMADDREEYATSTTAEDQQKPSFHTDSFQIRIPQFTRLVHTEQMYKTLEQLNSWSKILTKH